VSKVGEQPCRRVSAHWGKKKGELRGTGQGAPRSPKGDNKKRGRWGRGSSVQAGSKKRPDEPGRGHRGHTAHGVASG